MSKKTWLICRFATKYVSPFVKMIVAMNMREVDVLITLESIINYLESTYRYVSVCLHSFLKILHNDIVSVSYLYPFIILSTYTYQRCPAKKIQAKSMAPLERAVQQQWRLLEV